MLSHEATPFAHLPLPNRHLRAAYEDYDFSVDLTLDAVPLMGHQSWCDMLVTDPPFRKNASIMLQYQQGPKVDWVIAYLEGEFVTLGAVIDAALKHERRLWRADGSYQCSSTYVVTGVLEHMFGWVPRFSQQAAALMDLPGTVAPTEEEWEELEKEEKP